MNDPRVRQNRFNAESRDQWQGFADHRRRVSSLLLDHSDSRSTRLCVLGVGNGNDLEIPALLQAYREVHLVDFDLEALLQGIEKQRVSDHPSLKRHGGVDVTGMLDSISRWSPHEPVAHSDLLALIEWPPARVSLALPGKFDVVASTCLLSQIVGNAFHSVGENHPQFLDAVRAIRLGHLRLLVHLARPGGLVVLITDLVSTERFPKLATTPDHSLPDLMNSLRINRGLIHGVNPTEIMATFRQDPVLSSKVSGLESLMPWRWKLHARQYLVWALICRIGERS